MLHIAFYFFHLFVDILQAIFQSSLSLVSMAIALNVLGSTPTTMVSMFFAPWHRQISLFTGNMLMEVELELAIVASEKGTFRMVQ